MRWLCLDPGMKRTGVALSDPEGTFAVPLIVLTHDRSGPPVEEVVDLVEDHRAGGVVIGLPLSMDGTASVQTHFAIGVARHIAERLDARLEIRDELATLIGISSGSEALSSPGPRVVLWDERLTTYEAKRLTGGEPRPKGRRKKPQRLDAHAAAIILQSFLDAQTGGNGTGDGTTPTAREEIRDDSG